MKLIERKSITTFIASRIADGVEVWLHAVVHRIGVYPDRSFRKHVRLGTLVWMCDIKEVHDYISGIASSVKLLLAGNSVANISVFGFSNGKLEMQTVLEFPTDSTRDILEATKLQSELELGNFVDIQFKQVIDQVNCNPAIWRIKDSDWRVVAESKAVDDTKEHVEIENVFQMEEDAQRALKQAQSKNIVCAVKSVRLPQNPTAWLACHVETFS